MSLKLFLFLAPVAVGGYFVANREPAPPAGNQAEAMRQASAATAAAHRTTGPRKGRDECNALERQLLEANAPRDGNPLSAMAVVRGVEQELRRHGCDTMNGYGEGNHFQAPSNRMGAAPSPAMGSPPPAGTSFAPGRPMVDVRSGNGR